MKDRLLLLLLLLSFLLLLKDYSVCIKHEWYVECIFHIEQPTLHDVRSEHGGRVLMHQKRALREISLYLKAKKVSREFLFELPRIGRIKSHAELEKRVFEIQT